MQTPVGEVVASGVVDSYWGDLGWLAKGVLLEVISNVMMLTLQVPGIENIQ